MAMNIGVRADAALAAKLFDGLGDATRLMILLALVDGERRVTDLVAELGTAQSNVSAHLACLKGCGLVADRPAGRQTFYRLADEDVVDVIRSAEKLLARTGHRVELCPTSRRARRTRGR